MKGTALALTLSLALLMSAVAGTSSGYAAEDSWVSKTPMRQARNCRVAVVNDKIYAIGGGNSTNEEYDPATDTWTSEAPMPTHRVSFGIAVYQNKIYCVGGLNGTGVTGVNEFYDPATNTWETKAFMPTPRSDLQANVVNGKIYLIGGVENDYPLALNEVYDPKTDSWVTKAPMPTVNFTILAASDYASAVVDNKIYIMGGFYAHEIMGTIRMVASNITQIYDAENDSWSLGAPAPSPAALAHAATTTGVNAPKRIYVFGADTDWPFWMLSLRQFAAQSYDPKTDSWTVCASMPTERVDASVAVVNDKLYVIGGYTIEKGVSSFFPSTQPSAVNEEYTPFGYGTVPPAVAVISPENKMYDANNVSLILTVNKPALWMGFSLDGQETVTITSNTTIVGLANGLHNVTVYSNDTFGNAGTSKTIPFTIAQPEPFPTALVAIGVVSAAVIGIGLLVYFKKRKHFP
jgi:N-acetylneuraminic acid mutarotase